MKGLLVAIQFFTRLPTPRLSVSQEEFAASLRWSPAVGFIVGGIVASGAWLLSPIDTWVAACAALVLWVGVTGGLHLDGLADVADAAGAAHKDRAKLSAVLADPHVGSFGVIAVSLQLAAKLVLLHALIAAQQYPALLLVPFGARIGPLVWTLWLPSLHDGLASRFRGKVGWGHVLLWGLLLLPAFVVFPGLLAVAPLILFCGFWLRRRIGGISGDGHGAGIEVTESGLLFAAVLGAASA